VQQPAHAYIRDGQINFFRLEAAPLAGARAALLGVPWDGGTTYHPGARLAPWEVRRASALLQSFHPTRKVDVFGRGRVVDHGNVAVPPFSPALAREAIEAEIGAVLAAGAVPFVVGGDHSITYPILRAVAKAHGPVAVVHLDAHLDTSGPEGWGDAYHHGTPIRNALLEGLVDNGALHQVGIRAPWAGREDGALVADHGGHLHDMDTIAERGIAAVARTIRAAVGDQPVYLTLDVDGVDPAFAPGTGTPVPGGLSAREALALVRGLAGVNLVGMDVVEVCPARDVADLTVHLAAHLLFEGLALL
jgi:agmatinase